MLSWTYFSHVSSWSLDGLDSVGQDSHCFYFFEWIFGRHFAAKTTNVDFLHFIDSCLTRDADSIEEAAQKLIVASNREKPQSWLTCAINADAHFMFLAVCLTRDAGWSKPLIDDREKPQSWLTCAENAHFVHFDDSCLSVLQCRLFSRGWS